MKITKKINSQELAETAIRGMQEKKALDIVLLDLRKISGAVADFFIICTGNSTTQVSSIRDGVEEEIKKNLGEKPWSREGVQQSEWILVDYANVVIHIFLKEKRKHYGLENCWGDAKITTYENVE